MVKVVLVGNLGVGKSTILHHFAQCHPTIETFYEPISIWENFPFGDGTTFNLFENASKEFGALLNFQVGALSTFIDLHQSTKGFRNILVERCAISGQKVFIRAAQITKPNCISNEEVAILDHLVKSVTGLDPSIICFDHIVYLRAKIETKIKRIKERNRNAEDWINQEYIQNLDNIYDIWSNTENFSPLKFVQKTEIWTDDLSPKEIAEMVYSLFYPNV